MVFTDPSSYFWELNRALTGFGLPLCRICLSVSLGVRRAVKGMRRAGGEWGVRETMPTGFG